MSIAAFRAELGDIPVDDHPRIVQQRSRDHYWYSPVLKAKLDHVTAEIVVSPRSNDEVKDVLRAAYKHGVAITPRGAGTGNYGQAMPLSGGAMLNLMNMDK
ncbi:MAG: FAD-binding protein, partial [Alphaproteobacteria bacterium]|nr:FAD-binding protein [Alphaproteobacteria bacterium]